MVGGQALVQQSKIRTLISEINQYQVAVNTFKLEYNYLPGDIPKAYSYWGNSCDSVESNCNGSGNGVVAQFNYDPSGSTNQTDDAEPYRATQHLSLAKLINGNYSGVSTGNTSGLTEADIFYSKSGKGKFLILTPTNIVLFLSGNVVSKGNTIISIGGSNVGENVTVASFSVKEAYSIDTKIDDSVANSGKILSLDGSGLPANSCSSPGNVVGGADYNVGNLSVESKFCVVKYFLGY